MPTRYTLNDIQAYAMHAGGKCLSREYVNLTTPLKWRCEKGHTWEADFQVIRQGGWCPACLRKIHDKNERFTLTKSIAKEKGGICLSKEYISSTTKIPFKCAEGHKWLMNPASIKAGQWCPKCGIKSRTEKRKSPIEVYQNYAKQKGGRLLSTVYNNGHEKLLWQCAKGHQWSSAGIMVINSKCWCPYCIGRHKTIADMQEIAAKKGGKCLSKKYINSKAKLKWQCGEGHIWQSAPYNIMDNCWCPKCGWVVAVDKQKDDINKYRKFAIKKGGRLLSETYKNNRTPMLWQCKKGHQWMARAANVFHMKNWCPLCYKSLRADKKTKAKNTKIIQ